MAGLHDRKVPRIVAVCGGKGGVGKSTVAANLALAMGRLGHRVVIVDADLGAANLHTMLGIVHPSRGLAEFLDHRVDSLDDLRMAGVGTPTLSLVPGTSRPGSADLEHGEMLRLVRGINRLDTDVVVVDVGAGSSYNVVDLVAAADIKLIVMTPNLTALHNAYAMLKACVHRVVRKLCADETEQQLVDSALAHESKSRTILQLLDVLRPLDSGDVADRIADTLGRFGVGLIGNQVSNHQDASVLDRIGSMIQDHLMIQAPLLAAIGRSAALAGGLRVGSGTLVDRSDASYPAFRRLAAAVLEVDLDRLRGTPRTPTGTMPLWVARELSPGTV